MVVLSPNSSTLLSLLGERLRLLGHYAEAETVLNAALSADDRKDDIEVALGLLRASLARFDEAEASFRRAISLDPTGVRSRVFARFLCDRGRPEEAVDVLMPALAGRDHLDRVLLELANCRRRLGQYEAAIEYARRSLHTNPQNPEARLLLDDCQAVLELRREFHGSA